MCRASIVSLATIFVLLAAGNIRAQSSPKVSEWPSPAMGGSVKMTVLEPKSSDKQVPMIVYLENLAATRVGTDSDESIIHDFLSEGYLVVTLDYGAKSKARVPYINQDLFEIRDEALRGKFLPDSQVDLAH